MIGFFKVVFNENFIKNFRVFKKIFYSIRVVAFFIFFIHQFILAEPQDVEVLTFETAIEKAFLRNPNIQLAKLQLETAELGFADAWEVMWLPSISFNSSASSNYTLFQLPSSQVTASGLTSTQTGLKSRGTPIGTNSISVGQYTLFNFFKDKDNYDMQKLNIERARQRLKEAERSVKFSVINALNAYKTQEDLYDIAKRSVDYAQAVYDLIKSRIPLGKAKDYDLSSVEVDLINAKNNLLLNEQSLKQALYNLNQALGDPIGKPYTVKSKIEFRKFKKNFKEAIEIMKERSPQLRDSKLNLETARISAKLAKKSLLPLPAVSFTGVTFSKTFNDREGAQIYSTQGQNSGNMDVSVGLQFTMPLTGYGGLFGHRNMRRAEIQEEQAELYLLQTANSLETNLRNLYQQIQVAEQQIQNNQTLFREANQVFENALKSLQDSSSFNRLDLKDAITQLRNAEIQLTNAILQHYSLKLQIAELIGVDSFSEDKK